MNEEAWAAAKARWPRGTWINGRVVQHAPFGVFLDVDCPGAIGLILITEFRAPPHRMTQREFPPIGSSVKSCVLAFDDRNHQVRLTLIPEARQVEPPEPI